MSMTVLHQMEQGLPRSVVTMPLVFCQEKWLNPVISQMLFYLDPSTHTKIEEVGSANFFGITADNEFVTPLSPSILPSITKYSLLYLAEHRLGLKPVEGDVPIDSLARFVEAGACGTAAVISPIGGIQHGDDFHVSTAKQRLVQ